MRHSVVLSAVALLWASYAHGGDRDLPTTDLSPSATEAPACVASRTLPRHDRWQGFATVTVRGATVDSPQVVEFETDGIADVVLFRPMMRYEGRTLLRMERVTNGMPDAGLERCSTGWVGLGRPVQVRVPASTPGLQRWRVSVFEDTRGRPSDDDPYLIDLTVSSTTSVASRIGFRKDTQFSGTPSEPSISCRHSQGSMRPETELESVSSEAQDTLPTGASWLLYAPAGHRAYVSLTGATPHRVHVKLYAKEGGGRAYTGICEADVEVTQAPGEYLVGELPWERHSVAFWRLEVVPLGPPGEAPLRVSILREHNPLVQKAGSAEEQLHSDIGLLTECYQCRDSERVNAARRARALQATPEFVRLLPTSLHITTEGDLDGGQRALLTRALRAALGIWIVNCLNRCNFDVLSVVHVDREMWARADFSRPIVKEFLGGPASRLTKTPVGEFALARLMGFAPTAVAGDELYDTLADPTVASLSVCQSQIQNVPEILRVRQALGCAPPPAFRGFEVSLTLALRSDGHMACGVSDIDIACEADPGLLEFNTRDFSFCLPGDRGSPCIGQGRTHVSLLHILLHEAGHWLGLPHVEKLNAVMASTFDSSRCLSDEDLDALADSLHSQAALKITPAAFRLTATPSAHAP